MKASKKITRKVERRSKGYADLLKTLKPEKHKGYTAPGSRNAHKQG